MKPTEPKNPSTPQDVNADQLLETTAGGPVELSENDLDAVAGGFMPVSSTPSTLSTSQDLSLDKNQAAAKGSPALDGFTRG